MISQSRWDWVIDEVAESLDYYKFVVEMTEEELDVVVSALKNNTPFQVVPDHLVSSNNQQVVSENVVLETKNFSVLGDKE